MSDAKKQQQKSVVIEKTNYNIIISFKETLFFNFKLKTWKIYMIATKKRYQIKFKLIIFVRIQSLNPLYNVWNICFPYKILSKYKKKNYY